RIPRVHQLPGVRVHFNSAARPGAHKHTRIASRHTHRVTSSRPRRHHRPGRRVHVHRLTRTSGHVHVTSISAKPTTSTGRLRPRPNLSCVHRVNHNGTSISGTIYATGETIERMRQLTSRCHTT